MLELLELVQYVSVFNGVIDLVLYAPNRLWQDLQNEKVLIFSSSMVSLNQFLQFRSK